MYNIKLIVAYFGLPFIGWQRSKMGPSIEETLETTLKQILQHDVKLNAASRTDAGVHAEGQVVNFITHKSVCLQSLQHSLNAMLPKTISIMAIELCPKDFHPTLCCVKKEYRYHLCYGSTQMPFLRHTFWHFPYPLDMLNMQRAAEFLLGTHDFSSFCNERALWDRDPICHLENVEIYSLQGQQCLIISITGDHFLYKMVRNIAGTLAYVGCGKLQVDQIPNIIASRDRTKAGVTAPAHGLILKRVFF